MLFKIFDKIFYIVFFAFLLQNCAPEGLKRQNINWHDKSHWGSKTTNINFNGTKTLLEDRRINQVHKDRYPNIIKHYVLWRVRHDGSCWVQSGMVQTLYQMIFQGEKKYEEALVELKTILQPTLTGNDLNAKEKAQDFIAALEFLKEKMDFKFTLEFINHTHVFDIFNFGFRKLISNIRREEGNNALADKIDQPMEWGVVTDFGKIFTLLKLNFNSILLDDVLPETPVPASTIFFFDFWDFDNKGDAEDKLNKSMPTEEQIARLPKVISIISSPDFIDVAALKSFNDKINK